MSRGAVVLLLLVLLATPAAALDPVEVDFQELEGEWQRLAEEYGRYLPEIHWRSGQVLDFGNLVAGIGRFLLHELWANAGLLGQLMLLAVFSAVLTNLQSAFGGQGVAQVSRTVVYLVLLSVCLYSFTLSIDLARRTVTGLTDFVLALVPVMMVLLAGMGSPLAPAVFQPLLLTATGVVGMLVAHIVLPLIYVAALLAMVDRMMAGVGLAKLASFLKNGSLLLLGLLLTIFVGVTVLNGTVAAVADGVALRTGKYTAKAFIPVVGGMFADAFETVAGATLVLKNTVGIFGLLVVAAICGFPVLKLFAIAIIYRVVAALLQPLGQGEVGDTLDTMAGYIYALIGAVSGVALAFFLVVTVILYAGKLLLMVR